MPRLRVHPVDSSRPCAVRGWGLDDAGTLCWALPTDGTYAQWARLVSMPVPDEVAASTTMSVQYTSEVPAPSSGDSYASGCPTVAADSTLALTLVAR